VPAPFEGKVRLKSEAVKSVTCCAIPISTVASWKAFTAPLTSPRSSACRASWSAPCVSNPPIEQKNTCRVMASGPRAAISRAIIFSWSPSPVAGNTVASVAPESASCSTAWFSTAREIVRAQVSSKTFA